MRASTQSKRPYRTAVIGLLAGLSTSLVVQSANAQALPFERTEEREPCAHYDANKQPFFGDLHVHTAYSFDSYVSNQRNDPWGAYRYAKGEPITLANESGEQNVVAQIQRPLDFTGVTDHAEFLGPINVCTQDSSKLGYWFPYCMLTRANNFFMQLLAADYWASMGVASEAAQKERSFACTLSSCDDGEKEFWHNIQQAAEDHYDRSSECSFTTFVGYEYTDAPNYRNLHRNVIFRNDKIIPRPISTYDTGTNNFPELWVRLREQCIEAEGKLAGCDVIAIPHNPNLAGGLMFRDPKNQRELEDRLFFEPVVELVQHKAASECRFDRLAGIGVQTEDELCDFEQVQADNLGMLGSVFGETRTERADYVPPEDFAPRNMLRNVLKDGVKYRQEHGVNPFQMGFIASTDTHSAAPGGAEEDNYVGHLGQRDVGYRNVQDHIYSNPGGHAVVWAEENSRDAIFSAMKRKETYATSGTRPTVRFFGGWDFDKQLCRSPNMVSEGYAKGVPMGGNLPANASGADAPRFIVSAMKDPGIEGHPGNDLQRVQVIKGWVDAEGKTHEQVYDVAGDANNGASVDTQSCAPTGRGFTELCTVWEDPSFDAKQNAFYYTRVVENPSCRWSTLQCKDAGVDPFSKNCQAQADAATELAKEAGAIGDVYGRCCLKEEEQPFFSPIIQERAWTSPIWYLAPQAESQPSLRQAAN